LLFPGVALFGSRISVVHSRRCPVKEKLDHQVAHTSGCAALPWSFKAPPHHVAAVRIGKLSFYIFLQRIDGGFVFHIRVTDPLRKCEVPPL
jgi:hypothetical protein